MLRPNSITDGSFRRNWVRCAEIQPPPPPQNMYKMLQMANAAVWIYVKLLINRRLQIVNWIRSFLCLCSKLSLSCNWYLIFLSVWSLSFTFSAPLSFLLFIFLFVSFLTFYYFLLLLLKPSHQFFFSQTFLCIPFPFFSLSFNLGLNVFA